MSYSHQYAMPSRANSFPQAPPGFPQLPFNGPPPKPSHIRVNPQDWQNGSWSMNPAFNSSQWSLSSSQAWIPAQAWLQQQQQQWQVQQQQMQQAANFNPYKRVPRPPSAEYLATKLSDNPLGLSNMVPREQLYGPSDEEGIAAPTPWIWNPRTLDADDSEQGTSARGPQPNTRHGSEPPPSTSARQQFDAQPSSARRSFDATANRDQPPPPNSAPLYARHASQPREMSDPTPQQSQRRNSVPARHSSEPPSMDRPLSRPRQYQREGTPSASTPPRSAPPHQPETFTSSRELQPTFSANIVRTPQHYKSRSSSTGPQSIYASVPRSSSVDSQLANQMEQLSTRSNNTLSRQSSLDSASTSSSMTDVMSFVEEPASMLSPLVLPTSSHKSSTRPLGRHSSVPVVGSSSLSAIPEGPTYDPSTNRSPSHHQHQHHARHSRHTSPAAPVAGPPPTTLTPPRMNPLPEPPQELGRNPGITLPVQRTPPSSYRLAVRKGLWNRRGDHLTIDGFVVYAPADCAYPAELRDYPAETVGYRDHLGAEVGYLDSRPELPESLPRFGQAPRQPYEKFVVYEYLQ
ncbi:hypothetical protein C8J57DRAFT_1732233 [Mycena rebaudengoi]|nr:hypothetical protein C8J57DRAFT_1732233 [Mycena rebaudengoi]